MTVLTPQQVRDKYGGWSYMTWYRRREECLLSPYKSAIKFLSQKRCVVNEKEFDEFINWRSEQIYKKRYGLV